MNLEQMKDAKKQFEKAAEALENLDPNLLRITEQHMRRGALKNIRHSIGRLDGMIESKVDNDEKNGDNQ